MTTLTLTPLAPGSLTASAHIPWAYPSAPDFYPNNFYPSQTGSNAILTADAITPGTVTGSARTPGSLSLTPR